MYLVFILVRDDFVEGVFLKFVNVVIINSKQRRYLCRVINLGVYVKGRLRFRFQREKIVGDQSRYDMDRVINDLCQFLRIWILSVGNRF